MTKSTDVVHNASEFVSTFLKSHGAKDALNAWSASDVQNSYSKLFDASVRKRKSNSQDLPKRGKSAYLFFCQDMRQKVKEKTPDLSSKDITVQLGLMWNKIKDNKAEIAKYVAAASKDKERYDQEKGSRVPSGDAPVKSQRSSRSTKPKAELPPQKEVQKEAEKPVEVKVQESKPKSRPRGSK